MDFTTLSQREAEAYLAVFLAEEPARLQSLQSRWEASGESADILDTSPESLDPLWRWAIPRITRRDSELPPVLPSWAADRPAFTQFSDESLALIDEIARYFGAVILRRIPGARWAVARKRAKRYVDQNWPAVALLGEFINPIHLVRSVATGVLHGTSTSAPDDLRTAYELNTRFAREQTPLVEAPTVEELPLEGPAFEVTAYPGHPTWNLEITLDEWVAHELEDAVAELVADLRRNAGVQDAVHEDRERILVASGTATRASLEQWLRQWWDAKLAAYAQSQRD